MSRRSPESRARRAHIPRRRTPPNASPEIPPSTAAEVSELIEKVDPEARKAMLESRSRFLTRNPFLGVIALALPLREAVTVRTVTSDGEFLFYNPNFIREAAALLVEGHLLHALLHWALGHAWRGEGHDARRWQIAADLALVPLFLRSVYDYREVLPIKAPVELARNRSVEEIYGLLPEEGEEATSGIESEIAECWQEPARRGGVDRRLRDRWRERLVQAAQSLEYTGGGGEFSREVLRAVDAPRLDWRARLTQFLQRMYAQDYAWIPPNRRYLSRGLYLPGTRSRGVGDLVVAIDTSGSIDPETARAFLGEVRALSDLVGATGRLFLLQADDEVRAVTELGPGRPIPMEIHGRGGTDFRPVFAHLARSGTIHPTGLLYLTDGQGTFPDRPPAYPVLWILPAPSPVPFGERVILPGA
jgi:predicted metal-dependent peptidase